MPLPVRASGPSASPADLERLGRVVYADTKPVKKAVQSEKERVARVGVVRPPCLGRDGIDGTQILPAPIVIDFHANSCPVRAEAPGCTVSGYRRPPPPAIPSLSSIHIGTAVVHAPESITPRAWALTVPAAHGIRSCSLALTLRAGSMADASLPPSAGARTGRQLDVFHAARDRRRLFLSKA